MLISEDRRHLQSPLIDDPVCLRPAHALLTRPVWPGHKRKRSVCSAGKRVCEITFGFWFNFGGFLQLS